MISLLERGAIRRQMVRRALELTMMIVASFIGQPDYVNDVLPQ